MNPYLEQACRWFGAPDCESATAFEYLTMTFSAAFTCIVVVWFIGKVGTALRG